jgi:hypothetical protein
MEFCYGFLADQYIFLYLELHSSLFLPQGIYSKTTQWMSEIADSINPICTMLFPIHTDRSMIKYNLN